ncbi:MAG: hypothetical protein ACK5YO_00815 [Planctomyces sp.]
MGAVGSLRGGGGALQVCCPLTPDPSRPAGARGDLIVSFQFGAVMVGSVGA